MIMDLRTKYSTVWVLLAIRPQGYSRKSLYLREGRDSEITSAYVLKEDLHPIQTCLIERFEDIECGKEERTGATGGIKDCHFSDGFPEGTEELGPLTIFDDILRGLADVEIVGNQIVDVVYLSVCEFGVGRFHSVAAV